MTSQTAQPRFKPLIISLSLSAVVFIAGVYLVGNLNGHRIISRLVWPLIRLMFVITIGLVIGQFIEAMGWTRALARLAGPFFRFGNLGNLCSAAFTTAFFSGAAANAMLFDFFEDQKISRKQLYLSNLINQLPAFFLHLPTTFFIVIPLTGWAGALYFIITFLAAILRTLLFLIYGHFSLPQGSSADGNVADERSSQAVAKRRNFWKTIKTRLPGRITGIAVYVVPIYVLVFFLNAMGLFQVTREWLARYVVTSILPMESLSVVILSFAAEFTSGFAAAGALMEAGVLTTKQTVTALLLGNIIAFPIRALRHQLPRYMGIFAPKMGAQILFMGQGFRVASIILVGVVYFLIA